ncbi:S-layer homology domain-containing protein [Solibacillus cecembensis]|uniref:S-layer homology domain-containing protein n=1 Tax=Solibacillus cecembensis TaxID=459347 RepID=UPI003D02BFED
MDSKKTHKLSKASVAAVLAASGVIVAMPQPTHAYAFGDLNPNADYYEPVMDLYKRNIATGENGNFRPNEAITRADVARMIALSIDINTKNPKNPRFTDVQATHPNYKYIAALAEAGIISGFPDDSFKPDAYITRGQMAKIMSLGYRFGVSTKLTNTFQDVPATNANAYFIQTLVDLNITKGITPIAFEPSSTVTRGQMATFIWRAEKADKGTPVYTVGDITGDKVYINGVPYTIASSLSSIFNAANKRILQGAHIEGTFTSNTLTAVSKLTLNASGTSTSLLALDGDYSTFGGELIINGSYLRLKNIDLTGRVEVAETPRKSLANYMTNPLQNARIASINGFGFIDWGKPTDSAEEGFLNPDEDEKLTVKPDPTKPLYKQPYNTRMPKIEKYVDFSNSTVRNLFITQNRAFVSAEDPIDRITVQRDVTQYELYADANAMYIDTDVNVTVFGVNDIKYVYKNTLKNVFFHTDSYYDYLYVTTGSGFIDIGEHVYIGDAIIPPNKSVNDIFDDYENDDSNIGWIEDENGNPVERDPEEDLVVPDVTAPKILNLAVTAGGTLANVTLTADEDGMYYYMVKKTDEKPPSINEIKTGGGKSSGKGPIKRDTPVNFTVNDLETLTEYTIYVVVIDGSDNVSNKESEDFTTIDGQPPTLKLKKGDPMYGGKRVQFVITPTEAGTYYYYIRPKTSAAGPTVDDIIKTHTGTGKATKPGDIIVTEKYYGAKPTLEEIQPNTTYEIFAVMVDASGNKMRTVSDIEIKTEGPDTDHPFVNDTGLKLVDRENGIFELTVSEKLDKESAEDVNNYILSGTGIVNVSGQKEIKPSKVEYVENGTKIRLTIPSITALVKGDTIRATILPGVTDLAENPFENIDTVPVQQVPRNYAEYRHEDSDLPEIKIDNVITGLTKYEVEVTTKKAGTYYYMILPDNYFTGKDIKSRDFVDEFSLDPSIVTGKFQTGGKDDYLYKEGDKPAELGTFKFDVEKPKNLDPFTSYSIYMVLKDRSGQLSIIESKSLISDSKPPLVSNIRVESIKDNDTAVKIKLNVDEKAKFYAIPVKKFILDADGNRVLNTEYFNTDGTLKDVDGTMGSNLSDAERKASFMSIKGTLKEASSDKFGEIDFDISGLGAHEEYGIYIAAEDTYGNFTVRQRSNSTSTDPNEPSGGMMKKTFYTDGTKPFITNDQIVYRSSDATNFTITFNETIMRQKSDIDISKYNKTLIPQNGSYEIGEILVIEDKAGNPLSDKFEFVSYTVGTKTTDQSKLVIKPKPDSIGNQTFTVRMKKDILVTDEDKSVAYDYVDQNGFVLDKIGKYEWPGDIIKSEIKDAVLTGKNVGSPNVPASTTMRAIMYLDIDLTLKQTYYYAVTDSSKKSVDPQLVMDLVRDPNTSNNDIFAYGSGALGTVNAANKQVKLDLVAPPGVGPETPIFTKGNNFFIFTLDKYGNIIWAKDESNGLIYRPISNAFNIQQ